MTQRQDVYGFLAYLMNIVWTQLFPISSLLKSPVSAATKHGVRWLQLIWVQIPTSLWNWNYLILPGIPIFRIDSPLPNARDSVKLPVCIMQGGAVTIAADHLDNAGFYVTTKSSLLQSMHIISQDETHLQMDVTAAMLSFYLHGIILPYFFSDCI